MITYQICDKNVFFQQDSVEVLHISREEYKNKPVARLVSYAYHSAYSDGLDWGQILDTEGLADAIRIARDELIDDGYPVG